MNITKSPKLIRFRNYLFTVYFATSGVRTVQRRSVGWLKSDELERTWKGAVVVYFKILSRHSPGETRNEENQEKLYSGQWLYRPRFEQGTSRVHVRIVTAWRSLPISVDQSRWLIWRPCISWSSQFRHDIFWQMGKTVPACRLCPEDWGSVK
jgi:hypothetical protein